MQLSIFSLSKGPLLPRNRALGRKVSGNRLGAVLLWLYETSGGDCMVVVVLVAGKWWWSSGWWPSSSSSSLHVLRVRFPVRRTGDRATRREARSVAGPGVFLATLTRKEDDIGALVTQRERKTKTGRLPNGNVAAASQFITLAPHDTAGGSSNENALHQGAPCNSRHSIQLHWSHYVLI